MKCLKITGNNITSGFPLKVEDDEPFITLGSGKSSVKIKVADNLAYYQTDWKGNDISKDKKHRATINHCTYEVKRGEISEDIIFYKVNSTSDRFMVSVSECSGYLGDISTGDCTARVVSSVVTNYKPDIQVTLHLLLDMSNGQYVELDVTGENMTYDRVKIERIGDNIKRSLIDRLSNDPVIKEVTLQPRS